MNRTSERRPKKSSRSRSGKEIAAAVGAGYGVLIALSNIAMNSIIYSENDERREFARSDELSRDTSNVASRLAGYDVDVACSSDINRSDDAASQTNRLGMVNTYKLVDPLFQTHSIGINPQTMILHPSVCNGLVRESDYLLPREARQARALAYSIVLHEIIHLDYVTYDETATQCKAIDIMPERLEALGMTARRAEWATRQADTLGRRHLSDKYHRYECS